MQRLVKAEWIQLSHLMPCRAIFQLKMNLKFHFMTPAETALRPGRTLSRE
jgi:hypothetical protein